jgi:hypothetical protein
MANTPTQQQPTAAAAEPPKKVAHRNHPPDQTYFNGCPACRALDKARSGIDTPHIKEEDMERTTFLYPSTEIDGGVCATYIAYKYPNARWVGCSLDLAKLANWQEGEQIVVVRRDTWPKQPMAASRRVKDAEDKWETVSVPHEELMLECVEGEPIDVRKCMEVTRGDRFTKSTLDYMPLIHKLSQYMPLPYRIDLPKHKDDTVLYMVVA